MRKSTTIKPIMWTKPSFRTLSPDQKLIFMLLTTGPDTNLSGVVCYPLDTVVKFTGINSKKTRAAIEGLIELKRILWDEDYDLFLVIRWVRHNPLTNARLKLGALSYLQAFENHQFHEIAVSLVQGADPDTLYDTLSIPYRYPIDTPTGQGQGQGPSSPVKPLVNDSKVSSLCPDSGEPVREKQNQFNQQIKDIAKLLAQLMVENNSKVKLPKTPMARDGWLIDIDRLNRIDGYSWEEIEQVIRWCQADRFWKSIILSAANLRDKFSTLTLKMGQGSSKKESVTEHNKRVLREREDRVQ